MAPKLPPSRFTKVITNEATKTLTIISVSDDGVKCGPGTEFGNMLNSFPGGVHIFTEKLILSSDGPNGTTVPALSSTAGTLNISAAEIIPIGSASPYISVDGEDGVPNEGGATAQDKLDALNGKDGGILNLYVQNLSAETLPVSFSAKGGRGAPNNNIKSKGGNGGKGGRIQVFAKSNLAGLLSMINNYMYEENLPQDWSKHDEEAALEIKDNDRLVDGLYDILSSAASIVSVDTKPFVAPIHEQWKGIGQSRRTVFTITAALNESASLITLAAEADEVNLLKRVSVVGGVAGQAKQSSTERGLNGQNGKDGTKTVTVTSEANFTTLPDFVFVHPIQCKMLLDKAKAYFYFGDTQSRESARLVLESLLGKLSFLGEDLDLDSDSLPAEVSKYLEICAANRSILGLSPKVDVGVYLRDLKTETKNLYVQLTCTSIDYYGLREDWVPRTNPTAFDKDTDAALATLQQTETVYLAYADALKKKSDASEHISAIRGQVQVTHQGLDTHVKQLRDNLEKLQKKIQDPALIKKIEGQRKSLLETIEKLGKAVTSEFRINPMSVIKAAEMMAFCPNKTMGAIQASSLVYEAATSVPSDSGVSVSKEILLGSLKKVSGSLKDVVAEADKDSTDGAFQLDTEFSKKMLVEQQNLASIFDEFTKSSFSGKSTEAKKAFDLYTNLVITRNNDIVEYNLVLNEILASNKSKREILKINSNLEGQIFDGNDLTQLDNLSRFVEDMYTYNRSRVMKLLSYFKRAIHFSTLSQPDPLDNAENSNEAALNLTCSQLVSLKTKMRDDLFGLREQRGSDASHFPADYEKGHGKFFVLEPHQLSDLISKGAVDVVIPPVFKGSKTESEFRGCANIRIYRVRFWLDGLRTNCGDSENSDSNDATLVQIKLTHSGSDTFVDIENSQHVFRHEPLNIMWSYRLSNNGTTEPVDSGDLVNFSSMDSEKNTAYSAPGPFTTWTVSLENLNESRLDLSGVKRGRFEFFGTSRSFD